MYIFGKLILVKFLHSTGAYSEKTSKISDQPSNVHDTNQLCIDNSFNTFFYGGGLVLKQEEQRYSQTKRVHLLLYSKVCVGFFQSLFLNSQAERSHGGEREYSTS